MVPKSPESEFQQTRSPILSARDCAPVISLAQFCPCTCGHHCLAFIFFGAHPFSRRNSAATDQESRHGIDLHQRYLISREGVALSDARCPRSSCCLTFV